MQQKINAPPQSALGKAVQYALNQWPYLSNYIDYGEIEISNCWIENQIRPFALGRKNMSLIKYTKCAVKKLTLKSCYHNLSTENYSVNEFFKMGLLGAYDISILV